MDGSTPPNSATSTTDPAPHPRRHLASDSHRFRVATTRVPIDAPRRHHGRTPEEGFDCVGLVLFLYREAGHGIDELDMPYGERDARRPQRREWITARLATRFGTLAEHVRFRDGDVLLIGNTARQLHLGVVVNDLVFQMGADRVRRVPLARVAPWVGMAFRLKETV